MQAFGYKTSGDVEVIQSVTLPTPSVPADSILITTTAFGLNHVDAFMRNGYSGHDLVISGFDVAGQVSQVGSQVANFQVGDLVVAHVEQGAYAEQVVAPTETAVKLPASFPVADAAGLPTAAMTAYNALTAFAQVRDGQTVAILGAAGGIGSMAVQFAKQLGAKVIGVTRAADAEFVRQLGADQVASYDTENVAGRFANQADVVVNVNFMAKQADLAFAIVKPNGLISTIGEAITDENKPGVSVVHVHPLNAQRVAAALKAAMELAADQKLTVRIAQRFPFTLAGVRAASELNENGHTSGRIIVTKD